MAGAADAIRVSGLRDLQSAFKKISKDLSKELRAELVEVAEPVRREAELLAAGEILNIGDAWSQMRVGVTSSLVYVAPKRRRRRGAPPTAARPNLAGLLFERAMSPALDAHASKIEDRLERMVDRLGGANGF